MDVEDNGRFSFYRETHLFEGGAKIYTLSVYEFI